MAEDTIFDKILKKEIPCDTVYEDEAVLAFKDINPQAPVHIVAIPKKKVSGFDAISDLPADFTGRYMNGIRAAARQAGLTNGYRVVFNMGKDGQQTVDYLHAHILGGRELGWPPG
ncbi:MAG: histidine triad nucleotide-binding protein [Spirochaetia bacterium]|jgi:histidine triad (HIT) family protein|nr:histidine triad nucleotide-binding protein [Spirochaetia bacterium]